MKKAQRSTLLGLCVILILFGIPAFSLAQQMEEESLFSAIEWHSGYTLILMSNTDSSSANQARDFVISKGGRIAILSPPHVMLGWVAPELYGELYGRHGIELVTRDPVDPKDVPYKDKQTLAAVSSFNAVASGSMAQEVFSGAGIKGEPLINDAQEHPVIDYEAYLKNVNRLGVAPSPGNSDSMTGTVAVALFLVESNGNIDSNLYTWSATDQQNTFIRTIAALSWWSQQAPLYSANVSFTFFLHDSASSVNQTDYEPILHPSSDEKLWIGQIMENLGFYEGEYRDSLIAYNTFLREFYQTDWAYSVFVGYNPSPAPTEWKNGGSAYAWVGGPRVQMLFRNNGWSEEDFTRVLAHETGHIFWACDEYYPGGCTSCGVCFADGPRPDVLNGNCEYCNPNAVPCIMRSNTYAFCAFTPPQIGWGAFIGGTISGTVTSGGVGLSGVTINLTGVAALSTTTNANGYYSFSGLANGNYTITPVKSGYTFNPSNRNPTVSGVDVPNQDFTATPVAGTYTISGTVTSGGAGLSGVTINLTGAATLSTTTNANGYYSFTGLVNGNYTITPSKSGYTFNPSNRNPTVNGSNVTGQDFTATLLTYTISGTVTSGGAGLSGVTITLSGAATLSTTTNANGYYSFYWACQRELHHHAEQIRLHPQSFESQPDG